MGRNIYKSVASDLGLDEADVKEVISLTMEFIREKITSLPLKSSLTEEEFSELRTSFNLPSLGKLGCDYKRYNKERNKFLKKEEKDD